MLPPLLMWIQILKMIGSHHVFELLAQNEYVNKGDSIT